MGDDIIMDIPISQGEAAVMEGVGMRVSARQPPSVISEQLRDELIRILRTGDEKNSGAFTVAVAVQVEKFVVAAREILMTEKLAQNDLSSLMMMRRQHQMGPWGGVVGGGYLGAGDGLLGVGTSVGVSPVNNENFGVQAIRQVVEAIRTVGDSPAKLVEALAAARSNGLDDVAAVLEKKLGVAKDESNPVDPARPLSAPPSDPPSGLLSGIEGPLQ